MITTPQFGQKRGMAAPASAFPVISQHPMFSKLAEDERRELVAKSSLVRIPKYSLVFHQGDEVTGIYLILEGLVKLYRNLGEVDRTLGFLYRGDAAGIESLYADGGHPYSAQALGAVVVGAFPREAMQALAARLPVFQTELLRDTARRLEEALREQDVLATRSTNGRIADRILKLVDKFGKAEANGIVLQLRITQRELASMAGTNRESVCKALVAFKNEGSIDIHDKVIVVTNRSKLAFWP